MMAVGPPNPRRVRVYPFLAEKGIDIALEPVDIGAPPPRPPPPPPWHSVSPEFTALNPLQRTPVLVLDDGSVITESIAICRYFEELFPRSAALRQRRAGGVPVSKCGSAVSNSAC